MAIVRALEGRAQNSQYRFSAEVSDSVLEVSRWGCPAVADSQASQMDQT